MKMKALVSGIRIAGSRRGDKNELEAESVFLGSTVDDATDCNPLGRSTRLRFGSFKAHSSDQMCG